MDELTSLECSIQLNMHVLWTQAATNRLYVPSIFTSLKFSYVALGDGLPAR